MCVGGGEGRGSVVLRINERHSRCTALTVRSSQRVHEATGTHPSDKQWVQGRTSSTATALPIHHHITLPHHGTTAPAATDRRTEEVQCPALGREVFRAPAVGATPARLRTLTSTLAAGGWRGGSAADASGMLWMYSCELWLWL